MFRSVSFRSRFLTAALLVAVTALGCLAQTPDAPKRGRKYKAPQATSMVEVTVLRASTGKPVDNASVIFHPIVNGKSVGNMELKTNDDGKAKLDLLTVGSNVRVQVIAPGFQTYGEDYKIDKDKVDIEIRLKRPQEQYSVYKEHEDDKKTDKPADKASPAKPDAAAPPASTQPAPTPK